MTCENGMCGDIPAIEWKAEPCVKVTTEPGVMHVEYCETADRDTFTPGEAQIYSTYNVEVPVRFTVPQGYVALIGAVEAHRVAVATPLKPVATGRQDGVDVALLRLPGSRELLVCGNMMISLWVDIAFVKLCQMPFREGG